VPQKLDMRNCDSTNAKYWRSRADTGLHPDGDTVTAEINWYGWSTPSRLSRQRSRSLRLLPKLKKEKENSGGKKRQTCEEQKVSLANGNTASTRLYQDDRGNSARLSRNSLPPLPQQPAIATSCFDPARWKCNSSGPAAFGRWRSPGFDGWWWKLENLSAGKCRWVG